MSIPSIRLFIDHHLDTGAAAATTPEQAHYLLNVMRRSPGDRIRLFNGRDGEYLARLTALTRKAATVTVETLLRPQTPDADCWLCFALLKRQKTDMAAEKATELGATIIQPVITARTQADHVNLDRLRAIAVEAAEQCERLSVPETRPPAALERLLAAWPPQRRLFIADERRTAPLIRPLPPGQPGALLIGPEGGFTEPELEAMAAYPFVTKVSLGQRILRAETAAIAGLALLLAAGPDKE